MRRNWISIEVNGRSIANFGRASAIAFRTKLDINARKRKGLCDEEGEKKQQ
jgi:hypothetical protein